MTAYPIDAAPHFPELADRWNAIPASLEGNARAMLELLERARAAGGGVPLTVTSWYRSPLKNAAVGGASSSQHLTASAMDFRVHGDAGEWFDRVRRSLPGPLYGQMIYYEATSRHIHLSLPNRSSGITGEDLIEFRPGKYTDAGGAGSEVHSMGENEGLALVSWKLLGYLAAGVVALTVLSRVIE